MPKYELMRVADRNGKILEFQLRVDGKPDVTMSLLELEDLALAQIELQRKPVEPQYYNVVADASKTEE